MDSVTVIGLGAMGAAIVRSLLRDGHRATVWNRTPQRMQPLIQAGAIGAASVGEAVAASPTVISCIDHHASTRALLGADDVGSQLVGRTIIELSTGLPADARESRSFFENLGATYLDGKMLTGPHNIGQPNGHFIYAGPVEHFRRLEPMLKSMAGRTEHVGKEIGSASALDLAWLIGLFGLYLGVAHAAKICDAESVPRDRLNVIFSDNPRAAFLIDHLVSQSLEQPGAPLRLWRKALGLIQREAADAGISAEVPDFTASILDRSIAEGHGSRHIAAIAECIGRNASS